MVDFNFQIFIMSKRTLFNYFFNGSGSGSSTPHANEGTSQQKKPMVEFSHSIMTVTLEIPNQSIIMNLKLETNSREHMLYAVQPNLMDFNFLLNGLVVNGDQLGLMNLIG
jgi:hypothetical protein